MTARRIHIELRPMGNPKMTQALCGTVVPTERATKGHDGATCQRCLRIAGPAPKPKKPVHRDLQAVLESILHASKAHGADRQQHARAVGFVHGFWTSPPPPDMDFYENRAYDTGKRVGQWVESLMPEGFAR